MNETELVLYLDLYESIEKIWKDGGVSARKTCIELCRKMADDKKDIVKLAEIKPARKQNKKAKFGRKRWTEQEDNQLKFFVAQGHKISDIRRVFPLRTRGAIANRVLKVSMRGKK